MLNYDLTSLRVIVIDDSMPMRKILRSVLRTLGVRDVVEKRNGLEAFKVIKETDFDLVISDNMMQPMNGVELISLIRSGAEGVDPFLPFIMVSGFTDRVRILEARDAGVNEYLAKPISANNIYRRICSVIENPRDFVRTPDFFGPDRRRRAQPITGKERRQKEYKYR